MGKSIKPKYRAIVKFERIPNTVTNSNVLISWDCKSYGRPTDANANRWLETYNASLLPGGANEHLAERGIATKAFYIRIETNERFACADIVAEARLEL